MMPGMDVLERYAFVWDGSWPGWILEATSFGVSVLVASFGPSGPTLAEIKALRELDETLAALPVREVLARVGKQPRVVLGRYRGRELYRAHERAEAAGFRVTREPARALWCCLVHTVTGRRIQIVDEDEGRSFMAAMKSRGLPVIAIEAD
jgi:uncharacterized protein YbjT (DUF2867 family)